VACSCAPARPTLLAGSSEGEIRRARISTLRIRDADTGDERRLTLGDVRTGATCADDAAALCVLLG